MLFGLIEKTLRFIIEIPKPYIHIIRPAENQISIQRRESNSADSVSVALDLNQRLLSVSHIENPNDSIRRPCNKSLLVFIKVHRNHSLTNMAYHLTLFSLAQIIKHDFTWLGWKKEFVSISRAPLYLSCHWGCVQNQTIDRLTSHIDQLKIHFLGWAQKQLRNMRTVCNRLTCFLVDFNRYYFLGQTHVDQFEGTFISNKSNQLFLWLGTTHVLNGSFYSKWVSYLEFLSIQIEVTFQLTFKKQRILLLNRNLLLKLQKDFRAQKETIWTFYFTLVTLPDNWIFILYINILMI
jgi:hypothetical protein